MKNQSPNPVSIHNKEIEVEWTIFVEPQKKTEEAMPEKR